MYKCMFIRIIYFKNIYLQAAIEALHGLQSNSNYLKLVTKDNSQATAVCKLCDTKKYLIR